MKLYKLSSITLLLLCSLLFACEKSANNNDTDSGDGNESKNSIQFDNFSFNGNLLVGFTDGSTKTVVMKNGKVGLPINSGTVKTIKSIQFENQQPILIGRKENEDLILRFENKILVHQLPLEGFIPVGTYAEFQLINKDEITLTQHYKQVADIDLMNEEWTPIGRNEQIDGKYVGHFRGIFDGDLHELTNLKITKDLGINGYSGLFGQADDSNPHSSVLSELRNIIIRSGLITSKADKTGGVVASGNIVTNCINYVNINVENKYIGGIAGYIIGKLNKAIEISQCKNFGNIKGSDPIWHRDGGIGGIVGVANNFYIKDSQSEYLNICHIKDCSNNGQISGHGYIGGIVGISQGEWYPNSRIDGKISNSTNTGNIIGSGKFVGGIAGIATHINDCENSGIISSSKIESYLVSGTGGIAGSAVSIQASINNGKILGENSDNSGGIAGIIYTKVSKACIGNSNNGDVFGETNTAGIVGLFQVPYEFSLNFMTECSSNLNVGNVYGRKTSNYGGDFGFVGGIVGFASHQVIIENCINKGDITGEVYSLPNSYNGTIVSGIAAFAGRKLKNSYCVGKIFNKDKRQTSCVNAIACRYSPHEENDISSYEWNYWKDHIDDDAQAGFSVAGDKIYSLMQFSASSWPQWPLSTTSWKSLGSWNNGSPTYPKLYFEE